MFATGVRVMREMPMVSWAFNRRLQDGFDAFVY